MFIVVVQRNVASYGSKPGVDAPLVLVCQRVFRLGDSRRPYVTVPYITAVNHHIGHSIVSQENDVTEAGIQFGLGDCKRRHGHAA